MVEMNELFRCLKCGCESFYRKPLYNIEMLKNIGTWAAAERERKFIRYECSQCGENIKSEIIDAVVNKLSK